MLSAMEEIKFVITIKAVVLSYGLFGGIGNSFAMSSSGWDIAVGMLTNLSTACGAALVTGGAPVAAAIGFSAGTIEIAKGCYEMVYEDLQEGKKHMQDMGYRYHWNRDVKIKANKIYKETFPILHRSTSPDVFPEVHY